MDLKYTQSGFIYISPSDDCKAVVSAMLETDYNEEFCLAVDFSPEFVVRLMEAGFLVMSMQFPEDEETKKEGFYILLPKLHLVRSALFYENLHIKRSVRRLLKKYELRADADFDLVIDRCVEKHGTEWLTPPLIKSIKTIREYEGTGSPLSPTSNAYPASFALYRDGVLVAGEFGVVCGKVYTSYSGFYDENNAGTVQIIQTVRYLQEHGFSFLDMGMPLDYKNDLGAVDITPREFVRLFRS
ncbi:MAG: GNAT family N-acetyltransferase [Treponema sp.]|jgi:Leu/Phe-tRNA-protein transferase|nr:GNAT family N-acetyltransferase [Treponema sp.]